MKITEKKITDYTELTVTNSVGMVLRLTSLGAGIREIRVPDKRGESVTVTLCPTDEDNYRKAYFGKTIGRTAGRIAGAEFEIEGRCAVLEKNNHGEDNLHGGKTGFHAVLFDHSVETGSEYTDVKFTYHSPDGEGGYFGNVDFSATYRVYERKNTFKIIFEAESDCATLINPTNHVYLNMAGNLSESGKSQIAYINASRFARLNDRLIIEEILPVTPEMDFRTPHAVGDNVYNENVQRYTNGYDHQYFLDTVGSDELACSLYSPKSGIKLEMRTTYPCVVFYANSCPKTGWEVYPGKLDEQYLAACLECQYNPDGIHLDENCRLTSPDDPFREEIEYAFTVERD